MATDRACRHLEEVLAIVESKNPGQLEFHKAVDEVVRSLAPVLAPHPRCVDEKILERLAVSLGVNWLDDRGEIHVNRGYGVQMSSSIGPNKGGLRFHPTVNAGLLKFLAFEQTIKDSLITLPMGGAMGDLDFDPKGKSEADVGVSYAPSKAANAGGVAVSGFEMAQNMQMSQWSSEEVNPQLREILTHFHRTVRVTAAENDCPDDFVAGANIAGFVKVAAMLDQSPI